MVLGCGGEGVAHEKVHDVAMHTLLAGLNMEGWVGG